MGVGWRTGDDFLEGVGFEVTLKDGWDLVGAREEGSRHSGWMGLHEKAPAVRMIVSLCWGQ